MEDTFLQTTAQQFKKYFNQYHFWTVMMRERGNPVKCGSSGKQSSKAKIKQGLGDFEISYVDHLNSCLKTLRTFDFDEAITRGNFSHDYVKDLVRMMDSWEKDRKQIQLRLEKNQNPYQQGFDSGFMDGEQHKKQHSKPAFLKSIFSNKYMDQYSKGYKDGHFAGVRKARTQELNRIHQAGLDKNTDNREF